MIRYIRPSDFSQMMKPQGPLFAFIIPWLVVMVGQLVALCEIIKPTYSIFYLIIIGNIVTILLIAFFLQLFFPKKLTINKSIIREVLVTRRFKRITYYLIGVYLFGQIAQVIYFKGFPLYWLIFQGSSNYFRYGIKSLNGLLNAIYLLSTTSLFLIYLKEKRKKFILFLGMLLVFPVLMITRQVLICAFIQIFCCALFYYPKKAKKYFLFGAGIMIIFIVLGNFRSGLGHLVKILGPKPFIPTIMYPFLWIYAYIVTPFNNINAAIEHINPIGMPFYELFPIIPSSLRSYINFNIHTDTGFSLVHQNMTVSTFYLNPLLDFGPLYAVCMMTFFQFFLLLSYRKAVQTKSPIHIMEYSVLYMITILSIFSNLLFYLPVIFQLIVLNLAKIKFQRIKNHNVLSIGKI